MAPLASAETFIIADIRVEGLQRVSAGTVFAALPVAVGDVVDARIMLLRSDPSCAIRVGAEWWQWWLDWWSSGRSRSPTRSRARQRPDDSRRATVTAASVALTSPILNTPTRCQPDDGCGAGGALDEPRRVWRVWRGDSTDPTRSDASQSRDSFDQSSAIQSAPRPRPYMTDLAS